MSEKSKSLSAVNSVSQKTSESDQSHIGELCVTIKKSDLFGALHSKRG